VSFPIPLLRLRNRNVLFYCHYPDKLLSTERTSFIKRAYRVVLDFVEEVTTGCARAIVVNSNFTLKVFYDSFPIIRKHFNHKPEVLYPAIKASSFIKSKGFNKTISEELNKEVTEDTIIITSLNRYERKKNIPLALKSFHHFLK
jgi:alpha-1,3/alpha-1,6-mannosyltransferase